MRFRAGEMGSYAGRKIDTRVLRLARERAFREYSPVQGRWLLPDPGRPGRG